MEHDKALENGLSLLGLESIDRVFPPRRGACPSGHGLPDHGPVEEAPDLWQEALHPEYLAELAVGVAFGAEVPIEELPLGLAQGLVSVSVAP